MIDFSSDVRTFRDDFVDATPANLDAARDYLDASPGQRRNEHRRRARSRAVRSRAIREGDDDEYTGSRARQIASRLSLVLFVTDGEPTVGERDPAAIAAHAARLRGSQRVFTFGLGADVNAQLIEQLALEGHGTAQFVRPDEDVERAVGLVASRLTSPVASDLRVSVQCSGDVRCPQTRRARFPTGPSICSPARISCCSRATRAAARRGSASMAEAPRAPCTGRRPSTSRITIATMRSCRGSGPRAASDG